MSEFKDQITIFHHVSVDELTNSINEGIFSTILKDKYSEFVSFCNKVIEDNDHIKNLSCTLVDNEIIFDIEYDETIENP